MSNTESSAITRLISEAQGPVIEPYRSTASPSSSSSSSSSAAAAAANAQRLARGTIAPHQPIAAPRSAPQQQAPADLQASTGDLDLAELDELIEDPEQDDNTPLPRVLVEYDDPPETVGMAPLPAQRAALPTPRQRVTPGGAVATPAAQPVRPARVSAAIVAPLPAPAPFGTSPPQAVVPIPHLVRTPVAAAPITAQVWSPTPAESLSPSASLNVESMSYWEEEKKPRRTFLWVGLACALVGAGFIGFTALRAKQSSAATAAAVEQPAAVAATEPAPVAAAAAVPAVPTAEAETAAGAPAAALTAGFELPGIPIDTRVVFDGKQLGIGPMRVQRLLPGAHKLQLIAAGSGTTQEIEVDLTPDAVTPIRVPAAAPAAAAEEQPQVAAAEPAAPAPALAPEAAAAPEAAEAAPPAKASKHSKSHERAEEPKKSSARAAARSKSHDKDAKGEKGDEGDDAAEDASPKRAVASKGDDDSKGQGTLLVNAKPPCEIIVDGKRTGLTTPQRDLALKPGTHTILLINAENRIKKSSQVKISAGKPTRLVVDLTDQMQ